MSQEYFARIRPGIDVSRYAVRSKLFYAKKGWYKVSESLARELSKQPLNVLNPSAGPNVFEVKTRQQARAIETHENEKIDPAGTVDEPITTHDESPSETRGDMSSKDFAPGNRGDETEAAPSAPDAAEDDEDVPGLTEAATDGEAPVEEPEEEPPPPPKKVAKKRSSRKRRSRPTPGLPA